MLLQAVSCISLVVGALVWLLRRHSYKHKRCEDDSNRDPRLRLNEPASFWRVLMDTFEVLRNEERIHDWILTQCERYNGRPWTYSVIGNPATIVFTDPRVVEDILQRHFRCFEKGAVTREIVHDLVGNGLFAIDGEAWAKQRKIASALFTMRELRDSMALTLQQHTATLCDRLDALATPHERRTFDLSELLNRFTLTTFCSIGFGVAIDCLDPDGQPHPFQAALDRAQLVTRLRMSRPRWFWKVQRALRVGAEGMLRADMPVIDSVVYRIIHDSLRQQSIVTGLHDSQSATQKRTLVTLFLQHVAHGASVASPFAEVDATLVRDIVVGFLLAGRDTTAQTLSWCLLSLSQHPQVAAKLQCELTAELSDDVATSSIPSVERVQRLPYLDAVVHETLRLFPPVPFSRMVAVVDTVVADGTFVSAGTNVAFPAFAIGRMPHVWGVDAKQFKPERWLDADTNAFRSESPFKFLAFHAGPRRCVGKHLAMLELKLVLAALLQRFAFEIDMDGSSRDVSFKQKKMKTLVTRKKTRKRRMEAGMDHDDDSGRLFQPPSQRDPRWKKPSAQEIVRAVRGASSSNNNSSRSQQKRQKTAHIPTAHDVNDDDDDDDGFDIVAAAPDASDDNDDDNTNNTAAAASDSESADEQSDAEEYDDENAVKHPLRFCASLDDCIARGAALHQQIRKTDGRQKAKVLLLVETPSLRKGLKNKLHVKQELVKSKSRVGIRSVKANSMVYKHIAILKTPLERFEDANADVLKDFKTGKVPTLIAEDATFYPYADLKLDHVVFLTKTGAAAVNLDRSMLADIKLHVFVVADSTKAVTTEQREQLAKLYAVKA